MPDGIIGLRQRFFAKAAFQAAGLTKPSEPKENVKEHIGSKDDLPESLQRSYAERQKISEEKKATRSMFEEAGLTPAPKSRENLWDAAAADTMSKA